MRHQHQGYLLLPGHLNCLLQRLQAHLVQTGIRLVQDQQSGVAEQRPGQADALAQAAGQVLPAFLEHRVVALGQRHDDLVDMGPAGGLAHRFPFHCLKT